MSDATINVIVTKGGTISADLNSSTKVTSTVVTGGTIASTVSAGGKGEPGTNGTNGVDGTSATVAVGTTTTGNAGTSAAVANSGTSSAAVLNFTIPRGDTGSVGQNGNTVLSGTTTPPSGLGNTGDFYINTTANTIYGPKSVTWGSYTSLVGPTGLTGGTGSTGATGATGAAGTNGATWTSGTSVPSGGNNGDFYLKTNTSDVYKNTSGTWSIVANILGATGATGSTGAAGTNGTNGTNGTAATIAVGTTTTLTAGSSATVTNVGTSGAATFNFGIPKGADGTGAGDMLAATYDPTSKHADAFSQDNMASGTTNKNYTATEQTKLAAISGTNTGDETTATIKTKLSITTLSGSNTGDQTTVSGNAGTATTLQTARTIGTLTGDVTSAGSTFDGSATNTNATTVTKINGTALSGLSTGILKNTTTTGVPSIAIAGDFPTLNQSTTGSAATLTTPRTFQTNLASTSAVSFDGSTNNVHGVINTLPVANGGTAKTSVTIAPTASSWAGWDANKNLSANNVGDGFTTTATAAGTTTLTIASTGIQVFTGSTTQTVKLPTTSVAVGGDYIIINNSTGLVTVQSSGANTITILDAGTSAIFTAVVATPTTAANWNSQYLGIKVASGKSLSASNTLTLAGTDGTTMTFPSSSGTVGTLQTIYPVGCIYTETTGTNPGTTFGFGTWVAFGAGRVLVGVGTSDQAFTAGATGGESNHTLTGAESGTSAHVHPNTLPAFTSVTVQSGSGNSSMWGGTASVNSGTSTAANASSAHNNLQPYVVVYMWNRTA